MRNSVAVLTAVLALAAIAPAAATQISAASHSDSVVGRCLDIPACIHKKH